jgi:dihydrofolate reductase
MMNAIFAVNSVNGFGTGTDMPWPKSTVDLQRFKKLTSGGTVIMGSGTWNSNMPKPLPNRRNIVLSSTLEDDRCEVYRTTTDMYSHIKMEEKVWVIGGANLLWSLRPAIERVYITRFDDATKSSVTLDTEKYLKNFILVRSERFDDHSFQVWHTTML